MQERIFPEFVTGSVSHRCREVQIICDLVINAGGQGEWNKRDRARKNCRNRINNFVSRWTFSDVGVPAAFHERPKAVQYRKAGPAVGFPRAGRPCAIQDLVHYGPVILYLSKRRATSPCLIPGFIESWQTGISATRTSRHVQPNAYTLL
jgi:hypothetical protein